MRSCRALLADAKKVVASLDLDNAWKPLTATPRMSDIPQQAPDRKRTPNRISCRCKRGSPSVEGDPLLFRCDPSITANMFKLLRCLSCRPRFHNLHQRRQSPPLCQFLQLSALWAASFINACVVSSAIWIPQFFLSTVIVMGLWCSYWLP